MTYELNYKHLVNLVCEFISNVRTFFRAMLKLHLLARIFKS